MKIFGPDDNDPPLLRSIWRYVSLQATKRDSYLKRNCRRYALSTRFRSTVRRFEWINERYLPKDVIYMGDGIFDHYVMREIGYSIAPANAHKFAKQHASFVTDHSGGDRAVAEACLHIMEKFFTPFDPAELPSAKQKLSGEWVA